jgi:hypothetical protein
LQRNKADLANIALSHDGDLSGIEVEDLDFLFGDTRERLVA